MKETGKAFDGEWSLANVRKVEDRDDWRRLFCLDCG